MFHSTMIYYIVSITSIIACYSSSSIISQWFFLEVTMLSTLPLLIKLCTKKSSSIMIKYFLSQAAPSILLMTIFLTTTGSSLMTNIIILTLMFKIAIPPFHGWVLSMIKEFDYSDIFIIFVIQKFIPIFMFSQMSINVNLLVLLLLSSIFFLIMFMTNMVYINMIIFVSSTVNSFWIIYGTMTTSLWLEFMLIYTMFITILCFNLKSMECFNKMNMIKIKNQDKMILSVQFLNLSGIPPFSGFFLKLMMMKTFCDVHPLFLILILIMTVMLMFVYITAIFYMFTSNSDYYATSKTTGMMKINIIMTTMFIPLLFFIN